jgi:ferredoxin-type protein NapH
MTDPFVALQALLAHHVLAGRALPGAGLVTAIYVPTGGRSYCGWVCPINPVTDLAAWLRTKLRLPSLLGHCRPDRRLRYGALGVALAVSALLGRVAWETINPITLLQRALVFGLAGGYGVALAVFLPDLLVVPRGWCGFVCPEPQVIGPALHGAAHGRGPMVVSADCVRCGRCLDVCEEDVFGWEWLGRRGGGAGRAAERGVD